MTRTALRASSLEHRFLGPKPDKTVQNMARIDEFDDFYACFMHFMRPFLTFEDLIEGAVHF